LPYNQGFNLLSISLNNINKKVDKNHHESGLKTIARHVERLAAYHITDYE
jgi:hypothetical protein